MLFGCSWALSLTSRQTLICIPIVYLNKKGYERPSHEQQLQTQDYSRVGLVA